MIQAAIIVVSSKILSGESSDKGRADLEQNWVIMRYTSWHTKLWLMIERKSVSVY